MFRTLLVNSGQRIGIKDNWLTVETSEGEKRVPIEDLYAVVVDNQASYLTTPAIHRLTQAGTHILICNEKHVPVSLILPLNTHYHPLTVIRRQIEMSDSFKNALWDKIVKSKIRNQAKVLELCGGKPDKVARIYELAEEVTEGDSGNREGIAAKMFFREMYGSEFVRMNDDGINAALNYGYAIIRSSICKTLCAYGYNCVIGIHHISESNPFNLADDMMEPFRPVVDMWVDDNHEDLMEGLTRRQRSELVSLVNDYVMLNGRKMRIRNAMDDYVSSLTTAILRSKPDALSLPEIIRTDIYDEGDE